MGIGSMLWLITIVMCGVFLYISWRVKDQASMSFSNYAIGGKSFPMYLIFFTQFATIMGVGNFVGHAGKGYAQGLPWMAFVLGEQGSKIIFALFFAGLAGRFTYNTFPEMIDDLISRDKITRAMSGVLASMIMIAWVGGQGKAFGNIFNIATGADPIPIILLFSFVFIVYTTLGGIYSVVWTDLAQGILCVVFGVAFYIYGFKPVNWSMAELGTRLQAIGKAELWTFDVSNPLSLVTMFVTGCVGILVAQIYWQRCFSAKDSKTAKNGMLWSGIIAIIMVMLTALLGMVILTLNQGLKPDDAMPWFMMNYVPPFITAMIFALILAAGMSSADSNLNSASAIAAIFSSSILGLFSRAYSMAGGGLVPLLLVGLLWKERKNEDFEMGKKNSKVTPWGARIGIVVGSILTQITALGPNRVLIALVISAVLIVVISLLTKNVDVKEGEMTAKG